MRLTRCIAVTIRAHAKINLDLRVLGMRPDGFHELRTVFQALALHDTIRCIPREGPFAIECDDGRRAARSHESDLARGRDAVALAAPRRSRSRRRRAAREADSAAGRARRRQRRCGGDVDGAGACVARPGEAVAADRRRGALGADVPFFLSGGTALGLGRGDEIYPLADLPRHWIVLLIPGFGVSTSEAYGWYDAERELSRAPREPQHVPGRGRRAPRR